MKASPEKKQSEISIEQIEFLLFLKNEAQNLDSAMRSFLTSDDNMSSIEISNILDGGVHDYDLLDL